MVHGEAKKKACEAVMEANEAGSRQFRDGRKIGKQKKVRWNKAGSILYTKKLPTSRRQNAWQAGNPWQQTSQMKERYCIM